MDPQRTSKAISTSTPSFTIRYNAEDEEVEQLYDSPKIGEAHSDNSSPQSTPLTEKKNKDSLLLSKTSKRSGSLEEAGSPEPWRLFTEIRGRITKTVEEKIEEMNRKKKKKKDMLKPNSSLSDSEEKSEPSLFDSSSPEKSTSEIVSTTEKLEDTADSDLGDVSDTEISLNSDRATTPVALEVSNILPGLETKDISLPFLPEKRRLSAVFRNRQKVKHRRKVSRSDKIEVAVDALDVVEKNDTGSSLSLVNNGSAKSKVILYRKKVASSIIGCIFTAIIGIMLMCDIPLFLIGFFIGALVCLTVVLWTDHLFDWVFETRPEFLYLHGYYKYSNVPLLSDNMVSQNDKPEECLYTGWMNEFPHEYKPDIYHISQTETIYVKLTGSSLKLCTPKSKIPKRAMWNEPEHNMLFNMERTYDIRNCSIRLLPEGLVQKRLWSKKYPICIDLLPNSHKSTKFNDKGDIIEDAAPKDTLLSPLPKDSPVREIIIGEGGSKKRKWVHNLFKKLRKDEKFDSEMTLLEELEEQDVFLSDLDLGALEVEQEAQIDCEMLPKSNTPYQGESNEEEEFDDDDFKDYVQVSPSLVNKNNIYLFTRTDREKDLWFRRLVAATGYKSWLDNVNEDNAKEVEEKLKDEQVKRKKVLDDYLNYMKQVGNMKIHEELDTSFVFDNLDSSFLWLNLFIARVLYDPMKNSHWVGMIQAKISRKLAVIKVPSFMERFNLSQIEFTKSVPVLERSWKPKMNEDGLWVELDVSYQGICRMTIDTKINLMKLKLVASRDADYIANQESGDKNKSAYLDSSQEDSAETSCEEDDDPKKPSKPSKALMVIDKIAASKMFQQVTDNKLVKKAMENVSNTTISLNVEVRSLVGTVVLNIPPPPSDRLWYGFKPNTKLELSAKPRVGDHGINMGYITGLIEKKLYQEFQKILFMPNMDDLLIPIMSREKPF
ncbi:testis-expressed protein 2 isoform X2 [Cimex lectularius]|uniref:SMP-LTD domain-containing protein n=1 Tax=Cimex lectularius TaxID=79782 RepID=A0A8I6RDI7_CIMLE|nr:testis-expressed protein 2 isoform X2 [Cimex lectularius]